MTHFYAAVIARDIEAPMPYLAALAGLSSITTRLEVNVVVASGENAAVFGAQA
jgi:hypothetical protein